MKQKLTIQDIARLAGVSKATVSRVLNHKPTVDPEIRQRVLNVVNEKGFVPSITATVLRGGRSQLIGVLAPPLTWPFVPELVLGVAAVANRTSYEVVQYTMNSSGRHSDVLERLLAMKLSAGLLAIMPGSLGSFIDDLYAQGLPVVTIEDQVISQNTPWIGIDNEEGGYQATRHLVELGHQRIGHILGPEGYLCTQERYYGYCRALREGGLEPDPDLLWQGDFSTQCGADCGHQIFALPPEQRPTAIFAANDQMAFGVMEVAERYNVRIPHDLSLVGFDDMPLSAFAKTSLTTVRQPHREMGERACELLLSFIDPKVYPLAGGQEREVHREKGGQEEIRILLPTQLIVRESSAPPPSA